MKTRIYVDRESIKFNAENPEALKRPVLKIRRGALTFLANKIEINGPSSISYNPDAPLPCGCSTWIETEAPFTFAQ